MGFDSDVIQVAQPQLQRGGLSLVVMAVAMLLAKESSAQAFVSPAGVPAESRGFAGEQPVRSALVASGGQIIIFSSTRKQVTMNGQTAQLGERLGTATVTGISDSQLTMRVAGRTKKLDLYAGVKKRITNAVLNTATATATREGSN